MKMASIAGIKREVRRLTVDLASGDYAELMRELAQWASDEADRAEYVTEMEYNNNDNNT